MSKRPPKAAAKVGSAAEMRRIAELASHASAEVGRLAQIAKLAAFAVEARRVLTAIDDASRRRPDAAAELLAEVPYAQQWAEHEEVADSVLREVGFRLDEITETMDRVYFDIQAIATSVEA